MDSENLDVYIQKQVHFSEEVRQYLALKISVLLEHDFAKLVQLLYRNDIDEKKVKSLFSPTEEVPNIAIGIADLLIQKEIQKRYWRDKYKSTELDKGE